MAWLLELDRELERLLSKHEIQVSLPRKRLIQLRACPLGPDFTKAKTNILIQSTRAGTWQVYVDDDLTYVGTDQNRREIFRGPVTNRWKKLVMTDPLAGDVNRVIRDVLMLMESPMSRLLSDALPAAQNETRTGRMVTRFGRVLSTQPRERHGMLLTPGQRDTVENVVVNLARQATPAAPVLLGHAGCGKTTVARTAASELVQLGLAAEVVELEGARLTSGAVFVAERDERFRIALEASQKEKVLLVIEQFDLVLANSPTPAALVAGAIDRGLKFIGVCRPACTLLDLQRDEMLARRLKPMMVPEPTSWDVRSVVTRFVAGHPQAGRLEIVPETLTAVVSAAADCPGGKIAFAISLLERAICRAVWSEVQCVGPDDVYHQLNEE